MQKFKEIVLKINYFAVCNAQIISAKCKSIE